MKVAFLSIVYTLNVVFDNKIKRIDGFGYVEAYNNGSRSLYYS